MEDEEVLLGREKLALVFEKQGETSEVGGENCCFGRDGGQKRVAREGGKPVAGFRGIFSEDM